MSFTIAAFFSSYYRATDDTGSFMPVLSLDNFSLEPERRAKDEVSLKRALLKALHDFNSTDGAKTLKGIEREHILEILRQTNWIIGGRAGAAMQLGMQRSTLQSRMKKLGIARPSRADISAPSR